MSHRSKLIYDAQFELKSRIQKTNLDGEADEGEEELRILAAQFVRARKSKGAEADTQFSPPIDRPSRLYSASRGYLTG